MAIRHAVVSGSFYSDEPAVLRKDVETYIEESGVEAAPGRVRAIIAPHAGYIYSGPTAGYAFARVRGMEPRRVVLTGRSHRHYFEGVSIYAEGLFETPLGKLPVDATWAETLMHEYPCQRTVPHMDEHCLEVMLPFLQVVFGDVPIVPILFGADPGSWHVHFGERLAELMGPGDLLVASTDLSHYLPESQANHTDRVSLDAVLSRDPEVLLRGIESQCCSMCGASAVVAAMAYARAAGAKDWHLLDYRTSARSSGDFGQVVGYGALSMETKPGQG